MKIHTILRTAQRYGFIAITGCSTQGPDIESKSSPSSDSSNAAPATIYPKETSYTELKAWFAAAEQRYEVPAPLLAAHAYVATHWTMVANTELDHLHGQDPAFGVMALRGTNLSRAIALSGLSAKKVKFDPPSNILAAAAWFSDRADELGIDRDGTLEDWSPVLADFAQLKDAQERWSYVEQEVFAVLRVGLKLQDATQEVRIAAIPELHTSLPNPRAALEAGPDYGESIWKPSGNHSNRPSGAKGKPQMIIIHSCEGVYGGCTSWLRNKKSKVSAHYVVNSNGSEISQLVRHSKKAWHIGAKYKCRLNKNTLCNLDNAQSNGFTIGIEHAGFASQKTWDSGLIEASAKLACAIAKKHNIPRDAQHIVAHGQLQSNRSDPGANWPWGRYIERIRHHCGDNGPSSGEIVIDNNNDSNDTTRAKVSASGNWKRSSATSGHWARDYHFTETLDKNDGFEFSFYLDKDEAKTVEAWWTAGSNRSERAPFVVFDAKGARLETVHLDQRKNSSRWNRVGRFDFTRGWNRVVLSRWTNSPEVVIADAIRVR